MHMHGVGEQLELFLFTRPLKFNMINTSLALVDFFSGVSCLSDVPSRSAVKVYENIEENPGIKYSANAQCTLFFGRTSETCVRKKVSS